MHTDNSNDRLDKFKSNANKKIDDKKIRFGQFLTSEQIADFMVSLSSKNNNDLILEPSAGKGVFLKSLLNKGFTKIKAIEYDKEYYDFLKNNFLNIDISHDDFLNTTKDEKYDLIIGNPPYVQWNNIEPEIRLKLTESSFWNNYINWEWDIFYAFIIWSIEKLKNNGELIFIIPYNWFNSTHAKTLREYLIKNGYFDIILHFGELKLFSDCFPNNIIFKFIKSDDRNKKMRVCDYEEKKANVQLLLSDISKYLTVKNNPVDTSVKCFEMEQFTTPNMWFLGNEEDRDIILKIEKSASQNDDVKKYTKLSDYLDVGVGMVTGYDKAFILSENELLNIPENEKKFIFKFVKAKNCKRFIVENPSYYIFADEINSEDELKENNFIFNRLNDNKIELLKRYMSKNKKWWHWATVRNFELYTSNLTNEKIFIPCIDRALQTRFSYTKESFYGSGDVLMIVKKNNLKEDLKYIMAWLNSEFINKWYRIKGSKKGQRIQYTQSYVAKIPLKLIDWSNDFEVKIYHEIINLTDRILLGESVKEIEKEIDLKFEQLI